MNCTVNVVTSPTEWQDTLETSFPDADVYDQHAYLALHEEGQPFAVHVKRGDSALWIAGLKVRIPGTDWFDLQTPNGYGRPLMSPDGLADSELWMMAQEKLSQANIVTVFYKLNPLYPTVIPPVLDWEQRFDRTTVYVDSLNAEGRKRHLSKAKDAQVKMEWSETEEGWNQFEILYATAMARKQAVSSLRFSQEYFAGLKAMPETKLLLAYEGGDVSAGHVFLFGNTHAHYHLGARKENANPGATTLLMLGGIEHAFDRGLKGMHLGGGSTRDPADGVLRYKKGFGKADKKFEVARWMINPETFQYLVEEWKTKNQRDPVWLLGYREI